MVKYVVFRRVLWGKSYVKSLNPTIFTKYASEALSYPNWHYANQVAQSLGSRWYHVEPVSMHGKLAGRGKMPGFAGMHGEDTGIGGTIFSGFGGDFDVLPVGHPHLRWQNSGRHGGTPMHGDLTIKHGSDGAVTITHQPHGESMMGAEKSESSDEDAPTIVPEFEDMPMALGAGDTGADLDLGLDTGGEDPFVNAPTPGEGGIAFPFDPSDLALIGDQYDVSDQIPTARNYPAEFGRDVVGFEHRLYSGFGPAAIIGCDIGCEAPGGARVKG